SGGGGRNSHAADLHRQRPPRRPLGRGIEQRGRPGSTHGEALGQECWSLNGASPPRTVAATTNVPNFLPPPTLGRYPRQQQYLRHISVRVGKSNRRPVSLKLFANNGSIARATSSGTGISGELKPGASCYNMSVAVGPGLKRLARMPVPACSIAYVRTMAS